MLSAPQLPLTVRTINRVLRMLERIGFHPATLSPDSLLNMAQEQTGLEDTGGDSYRPGFERLLESLESEAELSPVGRFITRADLLTSLRNRLQLTAYHRANPGISTGPIERPIFIIGMGRSGTTILHELMALDENLRVPLTWEVDDPFPPPETDSYRSDPRIARSQKTLDRSDLILPDFKKIHRMGASLPQECVRFTTGEFLSLIYWTTHNVPGYARWLMHEADMAPAYCYHRRFLQLLQWRHPASQWVLKSPGHLWSLPALLQEYPDARFIQTHRDPMKILASLSSLVTVLRKMCSDSIDPGQIAADWSQWNARGLNASVEFRKRGLVADSDIIDISFYDFMQRPIEQVHIIYQHLGLELTPQTQAKMRDYLATNTAEQHGSHSYRFEDTGLKLDEERERVKEYLEFFDLRREFT